MRGRLVRWCVSSVVSYISRILTHSLSSPVPSVVRKKKTRSSHEHGGRRGAAGQPPCVRVQTEALTLQCLRPTKSLMTVPCIVCFVALGRIVRVVVT